MKTLKTLTIIMTLATTLCANAQSTTTKTLNFVVDQDNIEVRGTVEVSTEFAYKGYPYLKVKYSDLKIESFRYKGELYDTYNWNKEILKMPFYPDTRSYYIETEIHINMAVKGFDGSPITTGQNWGQNAYLEAKVYPVTDTYSNDKIDSYFKELSSDKYSDEDFWLKSYIEGIRITGISPNIIRQMTQIIDTH